MSIYCGTYMPQIEIFTYSRQRQHILLVESDE